MSRLGAVSPIGLRIGNAIVLIGEMGQQIAAGNKDGIHAVLDSAVSRLRRRSRAGALPSLFSLWTSSTEEEGMCRSHNNFYRYLRAGVLLLVAVSLAVSGCAQLGPGLVKAGRNDYNKVLAQTEEEETLLNLVRLRYADNPAILDVSSVSTSFTWNQGVGGEAFKYEPSGDNSRVGVRGNLDYTERPTITYTPLGGADFVRNVLTPVELDSLLLLSRSGWSIERLLRVMVNRMNGRDNAREASGPTPQDVPVFADFLIAAKLLRALQREGSITFGYRQVGEEAVPGMRLEPEAVDSEEARALSRLLGLQPGRRIFTIDTRARHPKPDALGVELRSLVGIMFFLSHAVDVPERDLAAGRVTITRDAKGEPFDWTPVIGDMLDIRSQDKPPENAAVAVQYRNSWFYIDDSDIPSKYTFMLLDTLTALQAGKVERAGPLLTLPVAGP